MIKTIIGTDRIQIDGLLNKYIEEERRQFGSVEVVKYSSKDKDFIFDVAFRALQTQSMFDPRKCVVINIFEKDITKEKELQLLNILNLSNFDALLILIFDKKPLVKSPLKKPLETHSHIVKIDAMSTMQRSAYIMQRVKQSRITMSQNVILELDGRIGNDMMRLEKELEKFSVLDRPVTMEDIALLVSKDLDDNIFALSDAVLKRNLKTALTVYKDLLTLKIDPLALFGMIASSLRRSYQLNTLLDMGMSTREISDILSISDKQVYFISKNQRFNPRLALKLLNQLAQKEQNAKSGKIDRFVAFELFLIDATTQ